MFTSVPVSDWERYTEVYDKKNGLRRVTDANKAFDTRIEVIDVLKNRVMTSMTIDADLVSVSDGMLTTYSFNEHDEVTLHVWRFDLTTGKRN